MKFNLNKPFLNIEGNAMGGQNQSQALAIMLYSYFDAFPVIKSRDFGRNLYKEGVLEIDAHDLKLLCDGLNALQKKVNPMTGAPAFENYILASLLDSLDLSQKIVEAPKEKEELKEAA